jgi:hypothetical protein
MRHSENINPLCPFCQHSIFHYKIEEVAGAFYGGQWYDNAAILTLKPDVSVEWDGGQTTENMSKRDLRKLHGMQQQPTFYNPILHVSEIVHKNYLTHLFAELKEDVTRYVMANRGIRRSG